MAGFPIVDYYTQHFQVQPFLFRKNYLSIYLLVIFIFERERKGGREDEMENSYLLVRSPNAANSWSLAIFLNGKSVTFSMPHKIN